MAHGQVVNVDRVIFLLLNFKNNVKILKKSLHYNQKSDEINYNDFKLKINEIATICFGFLFKSRKVSFNSYFNCVSLNLQVKNFAQPNKNIYLF